MSIVVGQRTMQSILEWHAADDPERTFMVFDPIDAAPRTFSYGHFHEQVRRTAALLRGLGLAPGDTFHVHLPNCPQFMLLWFAAACSGLRIMPTNPLASEEELVFLTGHSRSRISFTASAQRSTLEAVMARVRVLERVVTVQSDLSVAPVEDGFEAMLEETDGSAPAHRAAPADVVGILYTSGTTARPKGVLVSNANYIYAGETVARHLAMRSDDRQLCVLPLFHGNAQYYSTMGTLVTGASMVLGARFSASRYFDQAITHGATLGSLFAAPMRMILAQPDSSRHRDNAMRGILFAQSITREQLDEWQRRFATPLMQIWGMTETMGPPLMNPLHAERRNMGIGLPSMGYEVRVVDENLREVPVGDVGEIVVRGVAPECVMGGYFDNPEATAATLRDGWLCSGDNARQDQDGYFHFVDRAKDMIKRSGENVAASEVEAVLAQHPAVFDCAVVGVPDALRDEAIKAFVVLRQGEAVTEQVLIDFCAEHLASFRVPQSVVFRDTLPRTSVGKIQKHLLRQEGSNPAAITTTRRQ
jgi:crotonobetaine/carnitine-CoA ligase